MKCLPCRLLALAKPSVRFSVSLLCYFYLLLLADRFS
nr:MAG TPA: hypothetical protein [Caudoviricetes sp.]